MAHRRSEQNAYDGTSKKTKYGIRTEPQSNRPGTSEMKNAGLGNKPMNNQPISAGSESAIKEPGVALLDTVKRERSPSINEIRAEDDDVDENEDIEPNSERDANINSQQEKALGKKDDDVDYFFKSIAETVKKFPKKAVAEAKAKVLKLILEIEEEYDPDIPPTLFPISPARLPNRPPPLLTRYKSF